MTVPVEDKNHAQAWPPPQNQRSLAFHPHPLIYAVVLAILLDGRRIALAVGDADALPALGRGPLNVGTCITEVER